jgi:hypothetical protein
MKVFKFKQISQIKKMKGRAPNAFFTVWKSVWYKYGAFSARFVDAKTDRFYEEKSKILKQKQRDGRLCQFSSELSAELKLLS